MPKVRFEVVTRQECKHLTTVEVAAVPRAGEKVQPEGDLTYEIIDVMHTPLIRQWDAVVLIKPL